MNTQPDTNDKERNEGTAQAAPNASVSDAAAAFTAATQDLHMPETSHADEPEFDQRKAVNDGRLRKMSEDNKALKEEIEELKRQLAEQRSNAGADSLKDLPEMSEFDEGTRKAIYAGAKKIVDDEMRSLGSDIEALKRERAAQTAATRQTAAAKAQSEAFDAMEKTHPGLLARLGTGDLAGAWQSFLRESDDYAGRTYGEIVQSALARGNGQTLVKVAKEFVRTRNLGGQYQISTGGPRPAAAASTAVGTDAGGKKVYPSRDAIEKEIERIAGSYRKGLMDRKVYDERSAELEDALRSGRYVKQQ